MKLSQSLVTEAKFEINLSSPELYSKMSDRATQRILIEKKKKRKIYIILRNQAICNIIHTKVNAIQTQL